MHVKLSWKKIYRNSSNETTCRQRKKRITVSVSESLFKKESNCFTLPSYSFLSNTSGAIYAGVPTVDFG